MKRIFIFLQLFILSLSSFGQTRHLSQIFNLEKQILLNDGIKATSFMMGCEDGGKIYLCRGDAFQMSSTDYDAPVHIIDYVNDKQETIYLPYPGAKKTRRDAYFQWLNNMCVKGNKIVFAHNTSLLIYEGKQGKWKLTKALPVSKPRYVYFIDETIYVVSEENYGYEVYSYDEGDAEVKKVFDHRLEAEFLIQYGPNNFVAKDSKYLYALSAPKFNIARYNKMGDKINTLAIQIPAWQNMSQQYIDKFNALPYGSDRAIASFYASKKYSFPLAVMPLNERSFLFCYHHYDTIAQSQSCPLIFTKISDEWDSYQYEQVVDYFEDDQVIAEGFFPVYYSGVNLKLSFLIEDGMVQLCNESNVDMIGMTGQEYAAAAEAFYKKNDPIFKLRILKLKDEYR